jgi:hypothetical protein
LPATRDHALKNKNKFFFVRKCFFKQHKKEGGLQEFVILLFPKQKY